MNKPLRALLALCLALILGSGSLATGFASSLDYSVAEKFKRQLEAGSGFSGTLSLWAQPPEKEEGTTAVPTDPIVFDVSYISVRRNQETGVLPEKRIGLLYPSGATPTLTLDFSLKEGAAFLQSSALGQGWYVLQTFQPDNVSAASDSAAPDVTSPTAPTETAAASAFDLQGLLSQSAMPSLFTFLSAMAFQSASPNPADFEKSLASYLTKADLWIEGYRQNAVLGKLKDGTSTMEVDYVITPAAIKAQLKQMLLDLLSDGPLLGKLQALLPQEQADDMLNPRLQSHYFDAIDALPLEGDLTISRTVSLKGNTLALHMSLPFYDEQAGPITFSYDREAGEGDLPDENVVSFQSKDLTLRLDFQEYSSMTDVTVYQGTFLREPHGITSFEVDSPQAATQPKTLSASFTLTHKLVNATDSKGQETQTHDIQLSLAPLLSTLDEKGQEQPLTPQQQESYVLFPATDLTATLAFASAVAKNASTSINLSLSATREDLPQVLNASLSGKTIQKWPVDAFPTAGLPVLQRQDTGMLAFAFMQPLFPFLSQLAPALFASESALPLGASPSPSTSPAPTATP